MVIREDEARSVDDESGAGSTPRRIGLLPLRPFKEVWSVWKRRPATRTAVAACRRRVDIDDGWIEAFCNVSERDGSGRQCERARRRRERRGECATD
jgi:hypothetical protein